MRPPRWLSGQLDLGFRSFPLYRSFLILCGAAVVTVGVDFFWQRARQSFLGLGSGVRYFIEQCRKVSA